jgi:hypothetical protein
VVKTIDLHGERMVLKDATEHDAPFIFSSWMEEARRLRQTRLQVFNAYYPNVVQGLLETESAVVLYREGKDTIHAWACGRGPNLLHFAYVPVNLRRSGFGRAVIDTVLDGYPKTIHVTSSPLSLPHHPRFVYNPFVMRQAA